MCRGKARSVNIDVTEGGEGGVEGLIVRGECEDFQWTDWEKIQRVRRVSIPARGGDTSVETSNLLGAIKSLSPNCSVGVRVQGKVRFQQITGGVTGWNLAEVEGSAGLQDRCQSELRRCW